MADTIERICADLNAFDPLDETIRQTLRAQAKRIEDLEATLRHIATMDCYTREGEEPIHMLMMRQAAEAVGMPTEPR